MIVLDLLSTLVFALVGARMLVRRDHSLLVVGAGALITAVGGGTVRETLLGGTASFWLDNPAYLALIVLSLPGAYITRWDSKYLSRLLDRLDSVATAVFIVVGITAAMQLQSSLIVAAAMGALTGIGGSVARDLLIHQRWPDQNRYPLILTTLANAVTATVLVSSGTDHYIVIAIIAIIQVATSDRTAHALEPQALLTARLEPSRFKHLNSMSVTIAKR